MSIDIGKCISLNNSGAVLIQQGALVKATAFISSALKLSTQCCGQVSACCCFGLGKAEPIRFDVDVLLPQRDHSDQEKSDTTHHGFVHLYPLTLPLPLQECEYQGLNLVRLAISFNLGLAYHLAALNCPSSGDSTSPREMSLHFYTAARNLLLSTCKSAKALFQLAVTNNMAHILQSLGEFDMSRAFYQEQLSLILYMTVYKRSDVGLYEDYLRNAFGSSTGVDCACAA